MDAKLARENLKALVRTYCRATGRSLPQASKEFYGNTIFFDAFFRGEKSMSIDKYEQIVSQLRGKWPPDTAWPASRPLVIRRPERILSPKKAVAA